MNLENRLKKLELANRFEDMPLVMIKLDHEWTPEQKLQMKEAEAKKRKIIIINFV